MKEVYPKFFSLCKDAYCGRLTLPKGDGLPDREYTVPAPSGPANCKKPCFCELFVTEETRADYEGSLPGSQDKTNHFVWIPKNYDGDPKISSRALIYHFAKFDCVKPVFKDEKQVLCEDGGCPLPKLTDDKSKIYIPEPAKESKECTGKCSCRLFRVKFKISGIAVLAPETSDAWEPVDTKGVGPKNAAAYDKDYVYRVYCMKD